MPHVIVILILFMLWLLLPTRKQTPGCQKRTPKLTIIFRLVLIPFAVVAFWGLMFCIADVERGIIFMVGGVIAVLLGIGWCWGFTNFFTFVSHPTYYRLWKKGGGDPFFSTLDPPFNNDPDSVRYQELYQEKARLELEELIPPPAAPDFTKSIDDENVI